MSVIHSFPKVRFDFGAIQSLGEELAALDVDRPLIITDPGVINSGVFEMVRKALPGKMECAVYGEVGENEKIASIDGVLKIYRENGCNGVIAVGGGSVIGAARSVRILATLGGKLDDYRGKPEKITSVVAPCITLPTTAGTGSEITSEGGGLSSPHLKASVVICDPDLTMTLPPHLTAGTGMDALGHCIEGFMTNSINPPTKAIALDGIRRIAVNLERAVADGSDREARWNMLMAAVEGGMAIYLGLGPVHAMSHAFGPRLHHGTVIGLLIPPVLRFYEDHFGEKLDRIGEAMGLAAGTDIATAVADLNTRIGIPAAMREMGCENDDLDAMTDRVFGSHFNETAPKVPTREEYKQIISSVLG